MDNNEKLLKLTDEANSYIEKKEFDFCIELLEKEIELVKKNVELLKLYGLALINIENEDKALEIFEKVTQLDTNDATSWFYLASLYDTKNMLLESQYAYEKVIELREEYVDAHKNLAVVLIKLSEFEKANTHALKALELSSKDDYQIYYILATAAMNNLDYKLVINYLEEALKYNPTHVQILNNLGSAYLAINKKRQALSCYEKAYEIDSEYAMTNYNFGCYYQIQKKFEESFNYFEKAYTLEPTKNNMHALAVAAMHAKKWHQAIQLYTTLLALDPSNISYHESLAIALIELEDYSAAINSLKILHNATPNDMSIIEKLVDAYLITNQYDRLKSFLAKILKRGKVSTDFYYTYAIVCAKTGDYDTAVSIYKKVIQLEPSNYAAHKDLGVIYLMQKLFDWAEDEFKTAYNLAPGHHGMPFELATFYYQIHKYQEAEPYYEEALRLLPRDMTTVLFAGLNYFQLNKIDLAKKYLEKVYKKVQDDPVLCFTLARIYFAEKKYENARQILYSLNSFNKDAEIINLLAQIHFELAEYENARDIYKSLFAQNEDSLNLILNIAKCEIKLNNKDSALEYLNKYLEIFPDSEEVNDLIWQIS